MKCTVLGFFLGVYFGVSTLTAYPPLPSCVHLGNLSDPPVDSEHIEKVFRVELHSQSISRMLPPIIIYGT